jgi:hypothetical protein
MRATQQRQLRAYFAREGMTDGFVVVKQVRQVAFEEFSRFLWKYWDVCLAWVDDRQDSNAKNVLGKATKNAFREKEHIVFAMKVHSYNYAMFSQPGMVAANDMTPCAKARDNLRRVDLHKSLLADDGELDKHFLACCRRLEVENYEEKLFMAKQKVKLIRTTTTGFSAAERKAARAEARAEAAVAEAAGNIAHTAGPLNVRRRQILRILHQGYVKKLEEHCTCIGIPAFQTILTAVHCHNFVNEHGFKIVRDQLNTARNKAIHQVENVMLIKQMYEMTATRGTKIMIERDVESTDEEEELEIDDEEAMDLDEFTAAPAFTGARAHCEYKLGAEGLGYYHTELAKSRFKPSLLPGTEPCRPYGHVTPPPGLPGYLSKDMIKRCANIRSEEWAGMREREHIKNEHDDKAKFAGDKRRHKKVVSAEKARVALLESEGGWILEPRTGRRRRQGRAELLAPGQTMCRPSDASNKWTRPVTCNAFKLFNHYQMFERYPLLKDICRTAKLLEGPDPKDDTGRTIKQMETLPECNGNVSDIKVDAADCIVRLQKLQRAMAEAGVPSDINVLLRSPPGAAAPAQRATPPPPPFTLPWAICPPFTCVEGVAPADSTATYSMATASIPLDRPAIPRVPMPTTLRVLEAAPASSEQVLSFEEESDGGDSDDIDIEEFEGFA